MNKYFCVIYTLYTLLSFSACNATNNHIAFVWTEGLPVNVIVGPEEAIFCKIVTPLGKILSDGLGNCRINLERANKDHEGAWVLNFGVAGPAVTEELQIKVDIVKTENKPIIRAVVEYDRPTVTLKCYVESPDIVRVCKFRDPSGRILLANKHVSEDRYSFQGEGLTYKSHGMYGYECGIQITDPVLKEMGLWRCAMETENNIHYGFLKVMSSWVLRDPEDAAAIISEPTLSADKREISRVVGESVSMSCSIQSPIRYCYFRASNGSIFNVGPGDSHDQATYLGAGFDAGECGIQFPSLAVSDSGTWSCHVGLLKEEEPERRAPVVVNVYDSMVVSQRLRGRRLIIEAQVYENRNLEYCRFVRIDGFGFTTQNIPENYEDNSVLSNGTCRIIIRNPSTLENHPWIVVVRITGQDSELARTTEYNLPRPQQRAFRIPLLWIVMISMGLSLLIMAAFLHPKGGREWTLARANAIRNSIMRKRAQITEEKNTAVAA